MIWQENRLACMCAQEHGNLYVLYGCRAWARNPAAALKRKVVSNGNLVPCAQPFSCSSPVLQDWPELLILAVGTWCLGHWRPAGSEKGIQSWVGFSVLLQLTQLYYICEINHALISNGGNSDLCMRDICIAQQLYLLWFYCWLQCRFFRKYLEMQNAELKIFGYQLCA